jgi:hypothetical protein
MAWRIDHDYLDDGDRSQVGRASLGPAVRGETFAFRLRDDDGEVYYHGVADKRASETPDGEEGSLYEALLWAAHFAGCTDLQVRGAEALERGLTSRQYLDCHKLTETDWVSIFG